ncbi:MAG TPA: hypothetical protein VG839_05520 [Asticcacaulis sp.]|nr:hypothetical protein [Asticcacaulis sp.]
MFASKSITEHLVRGAIGIGAAIGALYSFALGTLWSLVVASALLLIALVAWRGCPMCWTMGLWQTVTGDGGKPARKCGCEKGAG